MDEKISEIKNSVKNFYSTDKRIKKYLVEGLTPLEEKIFKTFDKKGEILDACCGAGRVVFQLQKQGFDVVGFDLTVEMINAGKTENTTQYKNNFIVADAVFLPFKDSIFEYSVMAGSLEVIPSYAQRKKAVYEMSRVLKNGGKIFIHSSNLFYLGKFGHRILGFIILYILDIPTILWHSLKGNKIYSFGDVHYKTDNRSPYHHSFSKKELKKIIKNLGLDYKIFYTYDVVGNPRFSKYRSPDVCLLGEKKL